MRPLGILALVLFAATAFADPFETPTQLTTSSAPFVDVTSTAAGDPIAIWIDDAGVLRANGRLVDDGAVRAAVASFGEYALVVWTEANGAVMAKRVRPSGGTAGLVRRIGSNATGAIAIAASSDRYFVAWGGTLGEIYATIVNDVGDAIVPAMPVTTQSSATIAGISASASDDGYTAVWHSSWQDYKVFAITIARSGVPVSMTPLQIAGGTFADVTSNGEEFFVVWVNGVGVLQARTLTVQRELGRVRTLGPGLGPRVAWDGFAYTIAFARILTPRPGFAFPTLFVTRFNEYGGIVESLAQNAALVPRTWDVDARSGRLHLMVSGNDVTLRSANVREPQPRVRTVRR